MQAVDGDDERAGVCMPTETRLFHALVVFGASLTGGVAINACTSGGVDTTAVSDASADGEYAKISDYGKISTPRCPDSNPNCYPKISPLQCLNGKPPPCDSDAGADAAHSDAGADAAPSDAS